MNSALRSAPRYPASLRVTLSGVEGLLAEQVTNISAGGMFVRTERDLPIGTLLSMALELPDGDRPAPVQGKVVHARPSHSETGIGVQFVSDDDAFRGRVDRYINEIIRTRTPAVRLLSIARNLLQEKGWTQLTARDPAGSYCLTGALSKAAGGDREAYRAALRSMGPRLSVPACAFGGFNCHCAVLSWNDREGRTKNEVIAKLDEVISEALDAGATA